MTEVRALRAYADVALGRQRSPQHEAGPHMTRYVRAANVKDGYLDLSDVKEMNFDPKERSVFGLRPGDILMTEGSGSLGSVGASAVWNGDIPGDVCFQNTLLRLRPRPSTDARFLAWWCRHAFADGLLASAASGANIFHLSAERVRSLPMVYLPLSRQRIIADFLDRETARIDTLIAKKRRMVSYLQERFEAAVFTGVTGGLRGPRPMRPSGLSWLKEVPAEWGTPRVSANFELQLGKMLNSEAAAGPEQSPYLRNVNVQWDRIDTRDLATMHFSDADRRRCELRVGDVLICEGGEVGRAAVWMGEITNCYFQKAIHRARPRAGANGRYLMYCLRAAAKMNAFSVEGNLSTIVHLTGEQLAAHRFPWPPDQEQAEIVEELETLGARTHEAQQALTRQIELLQERRQALITAAVTGELEVSGVAA